MDGTPAAFFDLDKTVIAKASMVAMGKPLYREGLISRWLLLRAVAGQLLYVWFGADEAKLAKMRDSVLRLTAGWDRDTVRRIARDAIEEVIEPIVYGEALDLIAEHQAKGEPVFLVSASPEEIVAPLAVHLGVDGYLATIPEVGTDNRYTGRVERYCYGPEKVVAMREVAEDRGLDLAASSAYSDSATDEPMLAAVGHPVAVNPDRELLRIARQRGWEVRWFVRPVRLRDRIPGAPPAPVVAVGGGVIAAVAAAVTFWWLRRTTPLPPPPPTGAERVVRDLRRAAGAVSGVGRSLSGLASAVRDPAVGASGSGTVVPPMAQAWRTFLAATAARAASTRSRMSFFMERAG